MNSRNVFVLVSALTFCLTGLVQADWVQWAGNSHYYNVVLAPKGGITWQDAAAAAQAMGGYLATVHSDAENDYIFSLIQDEQYWAPADDYGNREGPWLGGRRSEVDYWQWAWVTGEAWTYSYWSGGEPNNSGGVEDRAIYFGPGNSFNKVWNDVSHDYLARSYVVESNIPEPTTMLLLGLGIVPLCRRRKATN